MNVDGPQATPMAPGTAKNVRNASGNRQSGLLNVRMTPQKPTKVYQ